jgi:hypothetical protein
MPYEFGSPNYNDKDMVFEAPIVPVKNNEDHWEWELQETQKRIELREKINEILADKAIIQEWLIWKIYYFLYFRKNFEVHINRVRSIINDWIIVSTYEQLIEARIITEEDVITNYKF